MKPLIAALAALWLASCAATAEQRAKADDDYCRSLGVAPGSPSYVECRLRRDDNREAARRAILADSGPTVCNKVGNTTICN